MAGDPLLVAGKKYGSRLLVGTGKYRDFAETQRAIEASGAEIMAIFAVPAARSLSPLPEPLGTIVSVSPVSFSIAALFGARTPPATVDDP